jgi:hypothetical protein
VPRANPVAGMAVLEQVSLTSIRTDTIQFHSACDGKADVNGHAMMLDYSL